jgi:sulfur carrier protein
MFLSINGVRETLERTMNLAEFLQAKGYPTDAIVVEYNGAIIRQPEWAAIKLAENDALEILRFVGGG